MLYFIFVLDDDVTEKERRVEPIVLTEDNVGEFQITDLVLPLPGYDVRYPDNVTASWYRELLAADGFEDFNFRNRVKQVEQFISGIGRVCCWLLYIEI